MSNKTIHLNPEAEKIWQELFARTQKFSGWVCDKLKEEKDSILNVKYLSDRLAEIEFEEKKLSNLKESIKNNLGRAKIIEEEKKQRELDKKRQEDEEERAYQENKRTTLQKAILENFDVEKEEAMKLAREYYDSQTKHPEGWAKWVISKGLQRKKAH
jgi:Fe-S cluster assembly scaffold protein SufB